MTSRQAIAFVRGYGVVLESARGPVPNFAEAVAGEPIRGSWWGHPKGHEIWRLTRAVRGSKEVLVCRLIGGKVTYVHRRLWPALVRIAGRIGKDKLAAIEEIHLPSGRHKIRVTPFPKWVSPKVRKQARALDEAAALAKIGFDAPATLR